MENIQEVCMVDPTFMATSQKNCSSDRTSESSSMQYSRQLLPTDLELALKIKPIHHA